MEARMAIMEAKIEKMCKASQKGKESMVEEEDVGDSYDSFVFYFCFICNILFVDVTLTCLFHSSRPFI